MESPIKIWRRQKKVKKLLNCEGRIVSWTMIHVAGQAYSGNTPFPVVLVELENGEKVYGQFVDYENGDLEIGKKVVSVLRILRKTRTDLIAYGLKFKPALA